MYNISKHINNKQKIKNLIKSIRFHTKIIKIKINVNKNDIFKFPISFIKR